MAFRLYLLLTDKPLYYALLELASFGFMLRAAVAANRAGAGRWLRWLMPMSLGLGLEPLSRLVRLAIEVVSSSPRLPRWEGWVELVCYWGGRIILIYGAFQLSKFVKAEAGPRLLMQGSPSDGESWPPPIRRGE